MKIIAIEEHWNSVSIRGALDRLQGWAQDKSVAFNTTAVRQFFDAIPEPADRSKIASGNAEILFRLT